MIVKLLNKIFKKKGFVLVDGYGKEHLIGKISAKENNLKIKLLKKKLHLQLLWLEWFFPIAYENGDIEIINGNISDVMDLFYFNTQGKVVDGSIKYISRLNSAWSKVSKIATISRSRKFIQNHYDVFSNEQGDELYKNFLCKNMVYSCGYFLPGDDLERAQERKVDMIIKKLRPKENEVGISVGSGWGFEAIQFAKKTKAKIIGITLSKNQLKESRRRAEQENLSNQVTFELMDWRNLDIKADFLFSVGALEHFQIRNYPAFFKKVYNILKPKGRALIHTICSQLPKSKKTKSKYLDAKIFEGGEIPSISDLAAPIENSELCILDMHYWHLMYTKTISEWLQRLRKNKDKIVKQFGEKLYRRYELYLSGTRASFDVYSDQHVVQILLGKEKDAVPPREYQYQ